MHREGHLFGEMALIDELPRSATVVAAEPSELLYIDREDFHAIISEHSSIALSIMVSISAMVRASNDSFIHGLRARNVELERANAELKDTQDELLRAERLSTLGKFASLVLHDIRNPLSVMRGYAELITHHAEDSVQVQENARRIVREADRLNQLSSELLDFSRGEVRLNVSPVDMGALVARVVDAVADRFAARHIELATDVQFRGPVLIDEARIYRVFLNLADNARKAMGRGGRFEITVGRDGGSLVLRFRDDGVGMSSDVQKRIFEPFFSSSKEGGSGLGMAIVKSVVDAHEGAMMVDSSEKPGNHVHRKATAAILGISRRTAVHSALGRGW